MNKVQSGCFKTTVGAFLLLIATAIASPAQTFTTLVGFNGTDGSHPYLGSLVQGLDGNLYGTTELGGTGNCFPNGCGTVFKVTPAGALTMLHSFTKSDGYQPFSGLLLATDGNFYGTTYAGGTGDVCADGCGTIFRITPGGTLTSLYSFFGSSDGSSPSAGLVQGTDGNLYGTSGGGAHGAGTVFKITFGGVLTSLYTFSGGADGDGPFAAPAQASDGNFYGTTSGGGAYGLGTIFKITPRGTLTTLYSFTGGADGYSPLGALVQATDGDFYGTTSTGGINFYYGTVFKMTPEGTLTTLHSFTGFGDGGNPQAPLAQVTGGNFYGVASEGGTKNDGTIFKISPEGAFTTLHNFDLADGDGPFGGLLQATSGNFYGTTYVGGAAGDGTIFRLAVGLGPFVETFPTSGEVGTTVNILGSNLTGATSVAFNGTVATFKVVSATLITTSVPAGATTGKVEVTKPTGTLSSNLAFRVKP